MKTYATFANADRAAGKATDKTGFIHTVTETDDGFVVAATDKRAPTPCYSVGDLIEMVRDHSHAVREDAPHWAMLDHFTTAEIKKALGRSKKRTGAIWAVETNLDLKALHDAGHDPNQLAMDFA